MLDNLTLCMPVFLHLTSMTLINRIIPNLHRQKGTWRLLTWQFYLEMSCLLICLLTGFTRAIKRPMTHVTFPRQRSTLSGIVIDCKAKAVGENVYNWMTAESFK